MWDIPRPIRLPSAVLADSHKVIIIWFYVAIRTPNLGIFFSEQVFLMLPVCISQLNNEWCTYLCKYMVSERKLSWTKRGMKQLISPFYSEKKWVLREKLRKNKEGSISAQVSCLYPFNLSWIGKAWDYDLPYSICESIIIDWSVTWWTT